MAECEMCGENVPRLIKARIESAVMMVCEKCLKYGTPVEKKRETPKTVVLPTQPARPRPQPVSKPAASKTVSRRESDREMEDTFLIDGFGEAIKSARERIGWTQDDLAKKIMEKKNVLSSIERGALMPDLKTARKLEKTLGIKLIEKVQ